MDMLNKLKIITGAGGINSLVEYENPNDNPDLIGDKGPSKVVKNVLSKGASVVIEKSRNTINRFIYKYHPPLSYDAINNKDDIVNILTVSENNKSVDKNDLLNLASNNLDTLNACEKIRNDFKNSIKKYINEIQESLQDDPNNDLQKELLINYKEQLDDFEKNEFSLKYNILQKIKNGINISNGIIVNLIYELDNLYPDWQHPIISRFMVNLLKNNTDRTNKLKYYCSKTLYSNPLDETVLKITKSLYDQDESVVINQIQNLLNEGLKRTPTKKSDLQNNNLKNGEKQVQKISEDRSQIVVICNNCNHRYKGDMPNKIFFFKCKFCDHEIIIDPQKYNNQKK